MESFVAMPSAELASELSVEVMRVSDERLNTMAMMLLSRTGSALHRRLIDEARDIRHRPSHRARLLRVLAATGTALDRGSYLAVQSLEADHQAEVRKAASWAISVLAQRPGESAKRTPPKLEDVFAPG